MLNNSSLAEGMATRFPLFSVLALKVEWCDSFPSPTAALLPSREAVLSPYAPVW